MDSVEIALHIPLVHPLKALERSQLINALAQSFRKSGIDQVVIKESYYIDRRSPAVPSEGITSLVVVFSVAGAAVLIIDALQGLVEDGKAAEKKLLITIDFKPVTEDDGSLLPDDIVTNLIWTARKMLQPLRQPKASDVALAYGTVVYPVWSSELIPVAITVTNSNIVNELIDGRLRGIAPQIKVKWFSCSICTEDIEHCEHTIGEKYEEKVCAPIPREIQFLQESLTNAVVDPRCRVTDLLLIERDGRNYIWYGFKDVMIVDRLKNIHDAQKDNLITVDAARKFRLYFSRRSVGHCKYHKGEAKAKPSVTSHRKLTKG